ncbi:hypothetical protein GWI33_013479 [Rhynchophorus ferrugineus]|uniref:Mos1 transposase HTH domain-containing protein n=1 Tax=Rhynchophorus ferrugineus TaxID=354439 RepID=A0A834I952_RHYFE|nr:hypothetical protein GWI33_013479 [Rhynchophorus ferrugineus]
MDKKEFRVLMKYYFLKAKNTVEARTWLDAEFPDTAPGQSTIKDWYANFRRGEMSTEHGERSGLKKEGTTINSDYYIALLDRLRDEIAEKQPHLKKNKVLLHQDNAPCEKSMNWAGDFCN